MSGPGARAAGSGPALATAPVVRTDLTNTVQVSGALGFAGSYTVANQMTGTAYTALPQPGQVVRRGHRLYEVDGSPVILLYGARPEWRDLYLGVTPGPDVAQLDANLIALGYATPATLTVSDTFTAATSFAVQRWQAALGLTVTGVVPAGQAAYAPGPLRVASLDVTLGAAAQPGTAVLAATSARPVVSAALPVGQEYLVRRGDRVSVTLPDGTSTVPGVVTAISRVAIAGASGGAGGASPGPPAPGGAAPGGSAGSGPGGSGDSVQLTVRLAHPRAAGRPRPGPGHGEHRQRPGPGRARGPGQRPGRAGRRGLRRAGGQRRRGAPDRGAHRAVQQQPGPGQRRRVAGRAEGRRCPPHDRPAGDRPPLAEARRSRYWNWTA